MVGTMGFRREPLVMTVTIAVVVAALVGGQAMTSTAARTLPMLTADTTSPLQVLTIGDSIMRGHGLTQAQAWPSLLAGSEGWTVTNAGCDGAGVLSVGDANQCTGNYEGIIDAAAGLNPDIIIFEGSSNDFGEDAPALLAATISELHTLRADFPDTEIVGLSTLWGYSDPPAQIAQVNAEVDMAVTAVGGTYVDVGQPMHGHPEWMQADDVHPNADGQAVLATTIQTAIENAVKNALAHVRTDVERVARLDTLLLAGRFR